MLHAVLDCHYVCLHAYVCIIVTIMPASECFIQYINFMLAPGLASPEIYVCVALYCVQHSSPYWGQLLA